MASGRPPSGTGGTPTARIGFDYTALRNAPNVAREAGRATARELQNAFKIIQNEQKIALAEAQQGVAAVKAQQAQITATTRSESAQRVAAARAESIERQQAARRETIAFNEEQKRQTAQFNAELRARSQAARQSQVSAGAFGRGAMSFTGALLGGFGGPVGSLAGGLAGGNLPTAAGLAVAQGARFAVEASQTATAFDRQELAARKLAGSQSRLNELMTAYGRATGGAVDDATELANVTSLLSQNFAKSTGQMERFVRGVRGASIATGRPQEFVIERAQFEMLNQTGQRLNEIGLGMEETRKRADELRIANQNLTKEQAYQQAIVDLLNDKYGDLTRSAEGQASGIERLGTAWKNLRLEIGQVAQGPLDFIGRGAALFIDIQTARLRAWINELDAYILLLRQMGMAGPWLTSTERSFVSERASSDAGRHPTRGAPAPLDPDQVAALRKRDEGFAAIERESALARQEETASYERQRSQAIANFEKQRVREAEDFGRQRLYAERKLGLAILDVAQDSARQRSKWEADSERTITKARADTAKRIADLDKDFAKDQARREKDFRDDQLSAAGKLDAIALLELRKDRARELQDRKEAHEEQRSNLQDQLAERESEERDSLQRSIEEQRENDRLRIDEMKANFEAQKVQEDEERAIRLERQAEDHQSQLDQLDEAHSERIQQIKDHAQAERDQFTQESNTFLEAVGIHNQKWLNEQEKINDGVIKLHQQLLDQQRWVMTLPPGHPSLNDPYTEREMVPGSSIAPKLTPGMGSIHNSRTVNVAPGAIVINGDGLNEEEVAELIVHMLEAN